MAKSGIAHGPRSQFYVSSRSASANGTKPPGAPKLELSRSLAEYTPLAAPISGRDRLVFVNPQKRLLLSVNAFARTLGAHARSIGLVESEPPAPEFQAPFDALDDEEDFDDELRDIAEVAADAARAHAG